MLERLATINSETDNKTIWIDKKIMNLIKAAGLALFFYYTSGALEIMYHLIQDWSH